MFVEYLIDDSSKNIHIKHMCKILIYQKHILDLGTAGSKAVPPNNTRVHTSKRKNNLHKCDHLLKGQIL